MDDLELKYYRRFRTGYTWQEVSDMLWSYSEDTRTWHKANATGKVNRAGKRVGTRRHSILGKWREIKLEMWHRVMSQCGGLEGYLAYLAEMKRRDDGAAEVF